MSTNPFVNAAAAALYIILLVAGIFYGPDAIGPLEETILMPITFLSLFVLSAATMGYLFLYQPLLLILDGKREEGARLFLSTVGMFAGAVVAFAAAMLLVGMQ